jgi:hypothetical protein
MVLMIANAGRIIVESVIDCKSAPSLMCFDVDHHPPIITLADFDRIFKTNAGHSCAYVLQPRS